uniref:Helicase ATP-binding domain-containing protein n=2 Tax=Ditylenchus dipsaci TaxID=166011 RepID=A0A915E690_9BILA
MKFTPIKCPSKAVNESYGVDENSRSSPTESLNSCNFSSLKDIKWQVECLSDKRLLGGENFILSLPTSDGKTRVAEMLMLRETLVRKRNCIIIVPLRMQETQFVDHSEDIERRTKVKFDPAVHSVQELKSKKFKFQFEQLLMEGKPAPMVVCKVEECRAILNWNRTSMRYHAKLHGSTANGAGEKFDDSLLKFIACSSQSINVVVDKSFLQLLEAFKDTVKKMDFVLVFTSLPPGMKRLLHMCKNCSWEIGEIRHFGG